MCWASFFMQFLFLSCVSDLPSIFGSEVTYGVLGDPVQIECTVVAFPEPKVAFWRSSRERIPIVNGGNYRIEHDDSVPIPLLDVSFIVVLRSDFFSRFFVFTGIKHRIHRNSLSAIFVVTFINISSDFLLFVATSQVQVRAENPQRDRS